MYFDFATMDREVARQVAHLIEKLFLPVGLVDEDGNITITYDTFSVDLPDAAELGRYIQKELFAAGIYQLCGIGYVGQVDKNILEQHLRAGYEQIASEGKQASWLWKLDYVEAIVREQDDGWSIDVVPSPFCRDCVDADQASLLLSAFVTLGDAFVL